MKERRGFTIVEVMIVIVIMAILLVIGTVLFRGYQSNARDKEREADVAAIQAYLEQVYPLKIVNSDGVVIKEAGTYPPLPRDADNSTDDLKVFFSDLSTAVMTPPSASGGSLMNTPGLPPAGSYRPASGSRYYTRPNNLTAASIGNNYVYAPGANENQLCVKYNNQAVSSASLSAECRRYTIFYKTEVGNTIQKVESKHR